MALSCLGAVNRWYVAEHDDNESDSSYVESVCKTSRKSYQVGNRVISKRAGELRMHFELLI